MGLVVVTLVAQSTAQGLVWQRDCCTACRVALGWERHFSGPRLACL